MRLFILSLCDHLRCGKRILLHQIHQTSQNNKTFFPMLHASGHNGGTCWHVTEPCVSQKHIRLPGQSLFICVCIGTTTRMDHR